MPNNNGIYNAAIAGSLAAFTSRWVTNISASFYQTQVLVATAFANQVDSLIAPGAYDEGSYRVMESICNAFWADRNPTSVTPGEYIQGAAALVAVFNQAQSSLAAEPIVPASDISYTPAIPADWPIVPTNVDEALNITGARDAAQETDIGTLQTDVGTLQTDVGSLQTDVGTLQTDVSALQAALPQDASNTPYTPGTSADWATAPTEVADALNQLANTRGQIHLAGALGAAASISYTSPSYSRQKSGLIMAWGQLNGTVSTAATITGRLLFADNAAPVTLSTVVVTMVSGGNWILNTFAIIQATQSTGLQWILDAATSAGTVSSTSERFRVMFIEL